MKILILGLFLAIGPAAPTVTQSLSADSLECVITDTCPPGQVTGWKGGENTPPLDTLTAEDRIPPHKL